MRKPAYKVWRKGRREPFLPLAERWHIIAIIDVFQKAKGSFRFMNFDYPPHNPPVYGGEGTQGLI